MKIRESFLLSEVQVNIPFKMLFSSYMDIFLENRLNPEIGLDAEALETFPFSDFQRISKLFNERGQTITLHAPFMDLSPGSPDPAVRALTRHRFEQTLRLVPLFKPKTVVCHSGYDWKRHNFMKETWVEKSLELWAWAAERIRDEGGTLMLENVYEHHPDEILVFLESLEDLGVGFCLDTGHQSSFSRSELDKWVYSLGKYIGQLHLHDNNGDLDEHLALGEGKIDFRKFFKLLRSKFEVPPVITLEPHTAENLVPSLRYLEKIWPW